MVLLKKGNQTPFVRGYIVCDAIRQKHQNLVEKLTIGVVPSINATNAFNFNFNFDNGNQNINNKNNTNYVRAVRDFKQTIYRGHYLISYLWSIINKEKHENF